MLVKGASIPHYFACSFMGYSEGTKWGAEILTNIQALVAELFWNLDIDNDRNRL